MPEMWYRAEVTVGPYAETVTSDDAPGVPAADYTGLVDPLTVAWSMADDYPSQPEHRATITLASPDAATYSALQIGQPAAVRLFTDTSRLPRTVTGLEANGTDNLVDAPPGTFTDADLGATLTGHPSIPDGAEITLIEYDPATGLSDYINVSQQPTHTATGDALLTRAADPYDPAAAPWTFHGRIGSVRVRPRVGGGLEWRIDCTGYLADLGDADVPAALPRQQVGDRVADVLAQAGHTVTAELMALQPDIRPLEAATTPPKALTVLDATMWQTVYPTDDGTGPTMPLIEWATEGNDNGLPPTDPDHKSYAATYPFRVLHPYADDTGLGPASAPAMWSMEPVYPRHYPSHLAQLPADLAMVAGLLTVAPAVGDASRGTLDACAVHLASEWEQTKAPPTRVRWGWWLGLTDADKTYSWHNLPGAVPTFRRDLDSDLTDTSADPLIGIAAQAGATFVTADPYDGWETREMVLELSRADVASVPPMMPNAEDPATYNRLAWLSRPIVVHDVAAASTPTGRAFIAGRLTSVAATLAGGRVTVAFTLSRSVPRPYPIPTLHPWRRNHVTCFSLEFADDPAVQAARVADVDPAITVADLRLCRSPNGSDWTD